MKKLQICLLILSSLLITSYVNAGVLDKLREGAKELEKSAKELATKVLRKGECALTVATATQEQRDYCLKRVCVWGRLLAGIPDDELKNSLQRFCSCICDEKGHPMAAQALRGQIDIFGDPTGK